MVENTGVVPPAYERVRSLITRHGGTFQWEAGGAGGGGTWILTLEDRAVRVRCVDNRVNALDLLYEPKVADPQTWGDYDHDAPLKHDKFWRLVAMFPEK